MLNVLVAEDHPVNQRVLAALLERLGQRARFVANGSEALQATAEQRFDLVLMDLHMPVMDGVAATQAIRARGDEAARSLKIVALSADAFAETRERCLRSGMDDFLSKPVDLTELNNLLARLFNGARAEPRREAPPAADASLLDRSVIDSVRSVMPGPRFAALLATFFDSGPAQLQEMRAAARAGRDGDLRALAHRLKGAALNLGLRTAGAAAQALQKAPDNGTTAQRLQLVDQLEAQLAASRRECTAQGLLG
jgi:CheY-like chemotaxis protein